MKNPKQLLKNIAIILYVLASLKCMLIVLDKELTDYINQQPINIPDKPANIPKHAVWHGGHDGGAWYDCQKTAIDHELHCMVYFESGEIWVKDEFELYATQMYEPYQKIPLKDFIQQDNPSKYYDMFFDGTDISLNHVITLEPKNYSPDDKSQFE